MADAPPVFDPDVHRDRHAVEYGINLLKQHPAAATRHDKFLVRYAATVHVVTIDVWLGALARTTFYTRPNAVARGR